MKCKPFKIVISLIIILVFSCNEPETVVTNYVHSDGSVTRSIEMRSTNEKIGERFAASDLQVPYDSSWTVRDTCETDSKGDSVFVRKAVKLFKNTDEINRTYKSDSGANMGISRQAIFIKKFRWFNTEYRFSEIIDKKILYGYPLGDFLNNEELIYFHSPENLQNARKEGTDSLKYKALNDSVNLKIDYWHIKNIVSMWINEFEKLTRASGGDGISSESLKARENDFVKLIVANDKNFDSLWSNGVILKEFIGDADAVKYKTEADSALNVVTEEYFISFNDYTVRIVMPGKVTGSNGYIDSSEVLLWPVRSEFFLTERYEMWAESRIPNRWAWIVSVLFLLFVFTGLIIRIKKRD